MKQRSARPTCVKMPGNAWRARAHARQRTRRWEVAWRALRGCCDAASTPWARSSRLRTVKLCRPHVTQRRATASGRLAATRQRTHARECVRTTGQRAQLQPRAPPRRRRRRPRRVAQQPGARPARRRRHRGAACGRRPVIPSCALGTAPPQPTPLARARDTRALPSSSVVCPPTHVRRTLAARSLKTASGARQPRWLCGPPCAPVCCCGGAARRSIYRRAAHRCCVAARARSAASRWGAVRSVWAAPS
jgi:hypothetical protein